MSDDVQRDTILREWQAAKELLTDLIARRGWSDKCAADLHTALWREMTIPIVESERMTLAEATELLNTGLDPLGLAMALNERPWPGTKAANRALRALGSLEEEVK